MTRDEKFRVWWERYRVILSNDESKGYVIENSDKSPTLKNFNWAYLFPGTNPLTLHHTMFTDSLKAFGTDE